MHWQAGRRGTGGRGGDFDTPPGTRAGDVHRLFVHRARPASRAAQHLLRDGVDNVGSHVVGHDLPDVPEPERPEVDDVGVLGHVGEVTRQLDDERHVSPDRNVVCDQE